MEIGVDVSEREGDGEEEAAVEEEGALRRAGTVEATAGEETAAEAVAAKGAEEGEDIASAAWSWSLRDLEVKRSPLVSMVAWLPRWFMNKNFSWNSTSPSSFVKEGTIMSCQFTKRDERVMTCSLLKNIPRIFSVWKHWKRVLKLNLSLNALRNFTESCLEIDLPRR
jgi:hypothetical protein